MNDTPDKPKPFAFVSFKNRAEFDAYLKSVDKSIPSFARAYYSMVTQFVMFYKDTEREASHFEFAVVAHEATHQVHDRYAPTTYGLRDVKSYWIVEGFAELLAGHKKDEKTGKMTFQNIHYPARMQMFGVMKNIYGDHDSIVYDNLKDDKDMPFLPPSEDWNICPIECLVTMKSGGFVMYYGRILGQMYQQGLMAEYNKTRDRKHLGRAMFLARNNPGEFTHGQFLCYSLGVYTVYDTKIS